MVVFNTGVVYEFPVATTVVPNAEVYQIKLPVGGLPIVEAFRVTLPPAQRVSLAAKISKKLVLVFVIPAEPAVAPFGGKLMTCVELVVPLLPPLTCCMGVPEEMEMYQPPPPPPGPSASLVGEVANSPTDNC